MEEKKIWIPKGTDIDKKKYHFLKIEKRKHSQYPNGLILTPYKFQDVIYHLKSKPIEERFDGEVIELIGLDTEPFIEGAYSTYNHKVKKKTDKDKRLLVYKIE